MASKAFWKCDDRSRLEHAHGRYVWLRMHSVSLFFISFVAGGFDWAALSKGDTVDDVGGGFGGVVANLAKTHKHLKFICQDRPQVVERGNLVSRILLISGLPEVNFQMWREQGNKDVLNDAVTLQGNVIVELTRFVQDTHSVS